MSKSQRPAINTPQFQIVPPAGETPAKSTLTQPDTPAEPQRETPQPAPPAAEERPRPAPAPRSTARTERLPDTAFSKQHTKRANIRIKADLEGALIRKTGSSNFNAVAWAILHYAANDASPDAIEIITEYIKRIEAHDGRRKAPNRR